MLAAGNIEDLLGAGNFYKEPFNYANPNLLATDASALLTGANFDSADFINTFFTKTTYRGAIGTDNWLQGWTNFTPLNTDYNLPR